MAFDLRALRQSVSLSMMGATFLLTDPAPGLAQPPAAPAAETGEAKPIASPGDQIVIKREGVQLIDPQKYRINFSLVPKSRVELVAPADGVIRSITQKPGAKVAGQSEILRLENTRAKLQLDRAKALFKVATLEQKSGDGSESAKAISDARLEAAKAELDLAQLVFDQTSIRAPFDGEIERYLVATGEFVRAGQPVVIVADSSQVVVEVPVERAAAEVGKTVKLKIEGNELEGKIESVLPLNPRFDNLRDLFETVTSAIVIFENTDGKLKSGMTVYPPMIPRQNVVEVPAAAILNSGDGGRKVQVVRLNVIRDIPVNLLASVGTGRLFVSGAFLAGDEVVYESSHALGDGFQIQPSQLTTKPGATPATPGRTPPPGNSDVGF